MITSVLTIVDGVDALGTWIPRIHFAARASDLKKAPLCCPSICVDSNVPNVSMRHAIQIGATGHARPFGNAIQQVWILWAKTTPAPFLGLLSLLEWNDMSRAVILNVPVRLIPVHPIGVWIQRGAIVDCVIVIIIVTVTRLVIACALREVT